ncbi:MAG: hypothetical protein ABWJ42_06555 [Sulfolobales archaeon]
MEKIGVEGIYEHGSSVIMNRRVLGKGFSSIVLLGRHSRAGVIVLKIRRFDSKRDSLEREALLLESLIETGYVPRVYYFSRDFILREFIEGDTLNVFLEHSIKDISLIRRLVRTLLISASILDLYHVDLEEISRADRQIIVRDREPEKIYYIDLESARVSDRASNLTKILSYIFTKKVNDTRIIDVLRLSDRDIESIRLIARVYKRENDHMVRRLLVDRIILEMLGDEI